MKRRGALPARQRARRVEAAPPSSRRHDGSCADRPAHALALLLALLEIGSVFVASHTACAVPIPSEGHFGYVGAVCVCRMPRPRSTICVGHPRSRCASTVALRSLRRPPFGRTGQHLHAPTASDSVASAAVMRRMTVPSHVWSGNRTPDAQTPPRLFTPGRGWRVAAAFLVAPSHPAPKVGARRAKRIDISRHVLDLCSQR
jgi:hypothetical protein